MSARFILAFPSGDNGNDITTSAQEGNGGNINISAQSLLGFRVGNALEGNITNDIDASSQFSLDGNITINTPDTNPIQGATELPTDVVEPGQTTVQACEANREAAAKNRFHISGKGGFAPEPGQPLNSFNIISNDRTNSRSVITQPVETSQGKIQPARGVEITESGEIILTAYRTTNSGGRLTKTRNCG